MWISSYERILHACEKVHREHNTVVTTLFQQSRRALDFQLVATQSHDGTVAVVMRDLLLVVRGRDAHAVCAVCGKNVRTLAYAPSRVINVLHVHDSSVRPGE